MRANSLLHRSLALGLLLAGAGAGTAAAAPPARCELRVERAGDSVALTALAHAGAPVGGRYTLRVTGGGTDIRQGGSFSAAPGRPATLGTVTLDARQRGARAALDLTVDGQTLSCKAGALGGV